MIKKIKKRKFALIADVFIFLLLTAAGAVVISPIYLILMQSLKPVEELFAFPMGFTVESVTFSNYFELFNVGMWTPFARFMVNSVFVIAAVVILQVMVTSVTAYCLAKVKFPGAGFLNGVIVWSLMFGGPVLYYMQYVTVSKLTLTGTYFTAILPYIAMPLGIYFMINYIRRMDDYMIEAAFIDGLGHSGICWQIVMPNAKPALVTLVAAAVVGAWQSGGQSFMYYESLKTLPEILKQIEWTGTADTGVISAAAAVMILPPVVLFTVLQGKVYETVKYGGIKE